MGTGDEQSRRERLGAPCPKAGPGCHSGLVAMIVLISLLTLLPSCPSSFMNGAAGQLQTRLTSLKESISGKLNADRQLVQAGSPRCVFPSLSPR